MQVAASKGGASKRIGAASAACWAAAWASRSRPRRKLSQLGYNAGTVDGVSGGKTVDALRFFQKDHNLPQTGRLDAATSAELSKH
ncbi:peptidoglycan-binding domain-containing protein [Xylophilus sp.]|uniref:peptidoglycan-binding domain-containing protein n=1 Tax=Xylophilus sp. TaxID=2653893 RepID=UPI0013B6023C|nr:peptidoglycan-binding domain-containing protein [Xylophilus sp.]KAF1050175.1 MAG: Localization factor PodJL [Xylophilus sp.]